MTNIYYRDIVRMRETGQIYHVILGMDKAGRRWIADKYLHSCDAWDVYYRYYSI